MLWKSDEVFSRPLNVAYLDIKAAFDSADHVASWKALSAPDIDWTSAMRCGNCQLYTLAECCRLTVSILQRTQTSYVSGFIYSVAVMASLQYTWKDRRLSVAHVVCRRCSGRPLFAIVDPKCACPTHFWTFLSI